MCITCSSLLKQGNKYWLYRDNDLQASDSLSNLFSFATPKDTRCFTCDAIHGREVGIIAISRSSSSFACTAEFSENKFKQKKCSLGDDDTDITLQKAMNTVGECKAYASKYAHGKLDFVYIGRNGIALAKEKVNNLMTNVFYRLKVESSSLFRVYPLNLLNILNFYLIRIQILPQNQKPLSKSSSSYS